MSRRVDPNDPLGLRTGQKEPFRTPPGFTAKIGIYRSVPITNQAGLVLLAACFGLVAVGFLVVAVVMLTTGDRIGAAAMAGCAAIFGAGFGISLYVALRRRRWMKGPRT